MSLPEYPDRHVTAKSPPRNTLSLTVYLAVYLAAILFFLGRIGDGRLERDFYYWADNLSIPVLIKSLSGWASYSQWRFPPNLYLFPDTLLFGVLQLTLGNIHLALTGFSVVQLVLYGLVMYIFLKKAASPAPARLVFPILALVYVTVENRDFYYWQFFLLNSFHFGAAICIVASLSLVWRVLYGDDTAGCKRNLALLTGLALVSTSSDFLYAVQFAGPMSLVLLFTVSLFPWLRRAFYVAMSLFVGAAMGVLAKEMWIVFKNFGLTPTIFDIMSYPAGFLGVMSAFRQLFGHSPAVASVCLVLYLLATVWLIRLVWRHGKYSLLHPKALFCIFCLLSSVANVLAGTLFHATWFRYFLPMLFIYPLAFAVMLAGEIPTLNKALSSRYSLAILLPALLVMAAGADAFSGLAKLGDYYPDDVACIDQTARALKLTRGLANYEQASLVNTTSKTGLVIASVFTNMTPHHQMNSLRWYAEPFDFALIDASSPYQLDVEKITKNYHSIDCGKTKMTVFEGGYAYPPFTYYDMFRLRKGDYGQ